LVEEFCWRAFVVAATFQSKMRRVSVPCLAFFIRKQVFFRGGMNREEKRRRLYEVAKLIKALHEDYRLGGVRCTISTYEEKKVGVLICGKNGAKKSLAKHWDEVKDVVWERVSRLYELLREEEEEEEDLE